MELSTKNINKTIRTIKRSLSSLRVYTSRKCNFCGKKIKGDKYLAILNRMGGFNHYHPKHLINHYQSKLGE